VDCHVNGPGRVSNISINGALVLPSFDIFVAAGAANTALDRTFVITVTNGRTVIHYIGVSGVFSFSRSSPEVR
jgi:hypothetical protein